MFAPKEIIFAPKKGARSLRHPSRAQVDTKLGNVVPRSLLRSVEAPTRNDPLPLLEFMAASLNIQS